MSAPLLLVVLDGFGIGSGDAGDAIAEAHTPFFDAARRIYPTAQLETSGEAVGLPPGQMGNSEVGHMTLGAGRVIDQDMSRISKAIRSGALASNATIGKAFDAIAGNASTLHLMGLVSDGGVHSHLDHLVALLELCRQRGVRPVVHAFLDGRDTPPHSGLDYVRRLLPHVEGAGGRIGTVMGRYFAMDRDQRWERIALAYQAIVEREGLPAPDPETAVRRAYERGESDEFVRPTVVEGGTPLRDGDGVIFFNFRADRARELTNAITGVCAKRFEGRLERRTHVRPAAFVCFTEYEAEFALPVAFPTHPPGRILGSLLAEAKLHQLRIAETEKYAHVTFFFNNGREDPFPGEDRVLIPSPRDVPTYDHRPEMSAPEVTEELLRRLDGGHYRFVLLNFANPDMVGHTGILPAAVKAVETIDSCLARITEKLLAHQGMALITADHGNCEQMVDPNTGAPHTAHTTNPVPLFWVRSETQGRALRDGTLADLAPTVLSLLGLPIPDEMTGRSLIAG